jgi:hypothetical protein
MADLRLGETGKSLLLGFPWPPSPIKPPNRFALLPRTQSTVRQSAKLTLQSSHKTCSETSGGFTNYTDRSRPSKKAASASCCSSARNTTNKF